MSHHTAPLRSTVNMMANANATHHERRRYDVCLCFRATDTAGTRGFTGNLYDALGEKSFSVFMGEEGQSQERGEYTSPSLLKALEGSRISIVVISPNFAASPYCLDELVQILECTKTKGTQVLPIFYDMYTQGRWYGQVLNVHRSSQKVRKWYLALSAVNSSQKMHFETGHDEYEYEFIQRIVEWVTNTVPRYDVFLSFSEKDTRYSFTGYLCNALDREGLKTFMKDDGDQSSQSDLVAAIGKSRLSIIVLSQNYAYSPLCLDELVTILDLMKTKNQRVWPIFYKVEPSHIRRQKGSLGEAMAKHENEFGKDSEKVRKWRSALYDVANLKGWHLKFGYEYDLIGKIVETAIKWL